MQRVWLLATAGLLVLLAAPEPAGAEDLYNPGIRLRLHIPHEFGESAVRSAVLGARRRLVRPECAVLLEEFRDAEGRSLRTNLDAIGVDPRDWLQQVLFFDGQNDPVCRDSAARAFTAPGSRVVRLCGRFVLEQKRDPGLAEALIIHEALHTLGLGENPPTSAEITSRVITRCGR